MPVPDLPPRRFATTRWSLVQAAGGHGAGAGDALASLCEIYWGPVYACIRRKGYDDDRARDLTQDFFAHVLAKDFFGAADRGRGRFRSFVAASVGNFLANVHHRETAAKRGGAQKPLSLEWETAEQTFQIEPRTDITPERLFDYEWALALLSRALSRLEAEHRASGKTELFDALKGFLNGENDTVWYKEAGAQLGMSEGAVKVAVHRLRRRLRDVLLDEVGDTVSSPDEVNAELQHLRNSIAL